MKNTEQRKGEKMKQETHYKAIEIVDGGEFGMALTYPKGSKNEFSRKFKTYEEAMQAVDEAILGRKHQYSYFRNNEGVIVEKISFAERHKLEYKIFKVVEQREELYSIDNHNLELKQPDRSLQEETPLTL